MLAIGSPDNPLVTDLSRYDDVLAWIDDLGRRDDDLLACWIGGSAATGGYDEHSDLDVNVLAAPGTFVRVYEDLVASLVETFEPTSVWRLPDATYSDGRQLFATFDDSPGALVGPTRLLDVVVYEPTDEHRHIDVRRHGTPLVRFDPGGLIVVRDDDEAELRRGAEQTVDQVRQRRLVAEWLVNRAIARNHLPEAVSLYLRFALLPVIQLLRARDCPARHDYLFRYLHTDLLPRGRCPHRHAVARRRAAAGHVGRVLRLAGRAAPYRSRRWCEEGRRRARQWSRCEERQRRASKPPLATSGFEAQALTAFHLNQRVRCSRRKVRRSTRALSRNSWSWFG